MILILIENYYDDNSCKGKLDEEPSSEQLFLYNIHNVNKLNTVFHLNGDQRQSYAKKIYDHCADVENWDRWTGKFEGLIIDEEGFECRYNEIGKGEHHIKQKDDIGEGLVYVPACTV